MKRFDSFSPHVVYATVHYSKFDSIKVMRYTDLLMINLPSTIQIVRSLYTDITKSGDLK